MKKHVTTTMEVGTPTIFSEVLLLDDDQSVLPKKNGETRKATHQKWWPAGLPGTRYAFLK